jgi:hypothetical protein
MGARWIGAVAAVKMSMPGSADEGVLRNGAVFSGLVREDEEKIVLEIDGGTIAFRRSEVREILRTEDPLKEFDQRLRGVADARVNDLFRKAIALDPDHEGARRAPEYERFEGRLLQEPAIKALLSIAREKWITSKEREIWWCRYGATFMAPQ